MLEHGRPSASKDVFLGTLYLIAELIIIKQSLFVGVGLDCRLSFWTIDFAINGCQIYVFFWEGSWGITCLGKGYTIHVLEKRLVILGPPYFETQFCR